MAANDEEDLRYVRDLWQACHDVFGMTDAVPGIAKDLTLPGEVDGVLAARTRLGEGVYQAILRRVHGVFCLSVTLDPDANARVGWAALDQQWSAAIGKPSPGTFGVVQMFLYRITTDMAAPGTNLELAKSVSSRVPVDPGVAAGWARNGVVVRQGFAVWEASTPADTRLERRLIVAAEASRDVELSAWVWLTRSMELPPLASYLLHAAKVRYHLRTWTASTGFRHLRREADLTVNRLLENMTPERSRQPSQAELLTAARELASLQARATGLINVSTRLREMHRTVDIASANMAALCGNAKLDGFVANDRELAVWFASQLDDDATYLESALHRAEQIGALVDRLVQRERQRRQESVNLGLTGVVGAILMSLAAIQSLQYTVPLPAEVKPAVVATLGAVALLVSLIVLRLVVPERRWSKVLVLAGSGAVAATLAWIGVSATSGAPGAAGWSWLIIWSSASIGVLITIILGRFRN